MTKRKTHTFSTLGNPLPGIAVSRASSPLPQQATPPDFAATTKSSHAVAKIKKAPFSLEKLLAGFDPEKHGGEVMAFDPIGKEIS